MGILDKQFFQGMFCCFASVFILVHVVPFFPFFHICFMWDSGFYMCPPLGFSLFPYFSFVIHVSLSLSLSLYFPWSLDHASLSPWAQGHAEVFILRRWLTIRKFDMKQMKLVLKKSKDDSARWENRITIKMKQNDKYDTPKSVAEMFSNFSKQIHGYAGEVQARNKGKHANHRQIRQ